MALHDGGGIVVVGIIIYLFGRISSIIVKNQRGRPIIWVKEIVKFLFALYMLLVVYVTLFPITIISSLERAEIYHSINLTPLVSILKEIHQIGMAYDGDTPFMIGLILRNVGGNILLLLPLGFLAPMLSSKFICFKNTVLLGLFTSIGIECLQLIELLLGIAFVRIVDIDDVICNVLGASIGYLLYRMLLSGKRQMKLFQNIMQDNENI